MNGEWKRARLEDVMEKIIDYRGKTPTKSTSGIPLITAKIVKNGRIEEPNEFIALEDYDSWMVRGFPKIGDVVMTTEAPLGEVAQIMDAKVALAQRIITLRGKADILDNGYLKYFIQSDVGQQRLKARETGTTVTGIKQSELREVEIDLPPLSIQTKIAEILSSLDDKIALNREMNASLEALAQTVFKEWFIKPTTEGVQNPVTLEDYIQFSPRLSIKGGQEVHYIEMSDLPTSGLSISNKVKRAFSAGSKFQNNDTLLARITPCLENGKTGFIDLLEPDEIAFGSTEFIVMRAKAGISPYFVYFIARDENFRQFAISNMIGSSGRQRVPTDILSTYPIDAIDTSLMQQFDTIVKPFFEKIRENTAEIETLTRLRDSLLPKLLRGEIAV